MSGRSRAKADTSGRREGSVQVQRQRFDSWKEIAAFFKRDERTVRRWEQQRGLPVHRVPGGERNLVYAYADELALWLSGGGPAHQPSPPSPAVSPKPDPEPEVADPALSSSISSVLRTLQRPRMIAALAATLLLGLGASVFLSGWPVPIGRSSASLASLSVARTAYEPSPASRDLYLTGVYHLGTRQANGFIRAIQYFTEATLRDPNYAAAYVRLADAYNTVSQFTLVPADEAYPRARAAAERALALDPGQADAYAALAFTEFYWSRNFARSRELFERAIAIDPASAQTRHWYALTLMHTGHFEVPLREIAKAQELNPESRVILANKALILFHAGRIDEATTILRQLADAEPNLRAPREYLATIYLSQQRYEDFLREYRVAAVIAKNEARLAIVAAAEHAFRGGGAQSLLDAMLREQKRRYALGDEPAYKLATTAALLGDAAGAIRYLEEAMQRREQDMLGILIDPAFKGLHGQPRYSELVKSVGFAPL